jgi:KDEL-tailed cysteine endopeptidase
VAIDASVDAVHFYAGGVLSGDWGKNLNHGLTIVGYGSQNGENYWTLKNSWGTEWGEDGYVRMLRGSDDEDGICGINMEACYPGKPIKDPNYARN